MINRYKVITFFLLCAISTQTLFSNFFSKSKKPEEIIHKKLPIKKNGTLLIENIHGNIDIKTEWSQNYIILNATKQISKKENQEDIEIKLNNNAPKNEIIIKTELKNDKMKSSIDYELIIPGNININLKTDTGSITVNKCTGEIIASTNKGYITIEEITGQISLETNQGNISVTQAHGKVTSKTTSGDINLEGISGSIDAQTKKGSIYVAQAQGNIKAETQKGNITLENSNKNIDAKTQSGTIKVACKEIPSTSCIKLATISGNIHLDIPKNTNADIQARTEKGSLLSDHFITLKPQTVRLNKDAWKRFKREVDGTIGSGEALIKLSANSGNIKISNTSVES